MYRLPGDRIQLDLGGPSVEVEPIHAWAIQFEAYLLLRRLADAEEGTPRQYTAFKDLCEYVAPEAQIQWDIVDHQGPVPTTARGMMRLPITLAAQLAEQWIATIVVPEAQQFEELPDELNVMQTNAPSAVDALVPPGPLNRELKRRLRVVRTEPAKAVA